MRRIAFLLVVLAGCGKPRTCREGLHPAAGALHDGVPVAVVRSWIGSDSGITGTRSGVIRDSARWAAFWREHAGPGAAAPPVDFGAEQVLIHTRRMTAGHRFDPVQVRLKDGILRFLLTALHTDPPGPSRVTTLYAFAVVSRTSTPVDLWYGHYDWGRTCAQWEPQRRIS